MKQGGRGVGGSEVGETGRQRWRILNGDRQSSGNIARIGTEVEDAGKIPLDILHKDESSSAVGKKLRAYKKTFCESSSHLISKVVNPPTAFCVSRSALLLSMLCSVAEDLQR